LESIQSESKPNQPEPSSKIRHHIVQSTVHLLQARLLLARMIREQEICSPVDLLKGRIKALTPIVDELLRLGALVRHESNQAGPSGDPEHISSIVPGVLAQMATERSAEGTR
jgi:hypothetical protein